jgi:hypothetical protein
MSSLDHDVGTAWPESFEGHISSGGASAAGIPEVLTTDIAKQIDIVVGWLVPSLCICVQEMA